MGTKGYFSAAGGAAQSPVRVIGAGAPFGSGGAPGPTAVARPASAAASTRGPLTDVTPEPGADSAAPSTGITGWLSGAVNALSLRHGGWAPSHSNPNGTPACREIDTAIVAPAGAAANRWPRLRRKP
jgi:hypothetical protein